MRILVTVLLGLLTSASISCTPEGRDSDRERLLALQDLQRRAHLEGDATLLVSIFADDFTNIQGGEVSRPSREESRARFQAYFDRTTFLAWEDVRPPVIEISDDGSMAHVIVQKRVRLRDRSSPDEVETTRFAWLETYRKRAGRWKLTAVASTRRSGD